MVGDLPKMHEGTPEFGPRHIGGAESKGWGVWYDRKGKI